MFKILVRTEVYLSTVTDVFFLSHVNFSACVSAGLAASSSVISPILSPVSTKLKSSTPAVTKPQEGETDLKVLCHHWFLSSSVF